MEEKRKINPPILIPKPSFWIGGKGMCWVDRAYSVILRRVLAPALAFQMAHLKD